MSDCPVSTEVSLTRRNCRSEDSKALPGLEKTLAMKTSLTKRFSKSTEKPRSDSRTPGISWI